MGVEMKVVGGRDITRGRDITGTPTTTTRTTRGAQQRATKSN